MHFQLPTHKECLLVANRTWLPDKTEEFFVGVEKSILLFAIKAIFSRLYICIKRALFIHQILIHLSKETPLYQGCIKTA